MYGNINARDVSFWLLSLSNLRYRAASWSCVKVCSTAGMCSCGYGGWRQLDPPGMITTCTSLAGTGNGKDHPCSEDHGTLVEVRASCVTTAKCPAENSLYILPTTISIRYYLLPHLFEKVLTRKHSSWNFHVYAPDTRSTKHLFNSIPHRQHPRQDPPPQEL